jgi:hypothetical protein
MASARLVAPRLVCAALLFSTAVRAEPKSPPRRTSAVLELRNLMSPAEFRTSGLDKLSARELASLDDWLGRLVVRLLTDRKATGCETALKSRIDGDFEGWNGDTLFQLENGHVWKQRGTASHYVYRYSPPVLIYRSEAGCRMKVDGVGDEILVERLK